MKSETENLGRPSSCTTGTPDSRYNYQIQCKLPNLPVLGLLNSQHLITFNVSRRSMKIAAYVCTTLLSERRRAITRGSASRRDAFGR